MDWKLEAKTCVCGEIETEEHLLLDCGLYNDERTELDDLWNSEGTMDRMKCLKGYIHVNERLDQLSISCMGRIWTKRRKLECERRRNANV